jgi:3-hydroxyacyl-[acyl-carrier-protein] dehydratase
MSRDETANGSEQHNGIEATEGFTPPDFVPPALANFQVDVSSAEMALLRRMPHRYPLVLVDRIVFYRPPGHARVSKNVTTNEPYFAGLERHHMVMPTAYLLEAMAQACGLLYGLAGLSETANALILARIDQCRFDRSVVPGDQLLMDAELSAVKRGIARFKVRAFLGTGESVARSDFMFTPAIH